MENDAERLSRGPTAVRQNNCQLRRNESMKLIYEHLSCGSIGAGRNRCQPQQNEPMEIDTGMPTAMISYPLTMEMLLQNSGLHVASSRRCSEDNDNAMDNLSPQ